MAHEVGYTVKHRFFSRRNRVTLCEDNGVCFVQKIFDDPVSAERESDCYALLLEQGVSVPVPLFKGPKELHLTYIRGSTALELLEEQELELQENPEEESVLSIEPWQKLALWCCDFYRKSGLVSGDPNLRNFIMESDSGRWFGVDFECCSTGDCSQDFARLLAFLMTYSPENTPLKRRISNEMRNIFSKEMHIDTDQLKNLQETAVRKLIEQRRMRKEGYNESSISRRNKAYRSKRCSKTCTRKGRSIGKS